MLASINPLGERGRNQRYAVTVTAFVTGSLVAGALLGGVLGALGSLVPVGTPVAIVVVLALTGLLLDATGRVPGAHRQVNEDWLTRYRGWVYGAAFGAQLGMAFTTIVASSATWLAFACAFLSGSPIAGAAIGAVFGIVRALPVLLTARVRDAATLNARLRGVEHARTRVALVTTVVQVVLALALVAAVLA